MACFDVLLRHRQNDGRIKMSQYKKGSQRLPATFHNECTPMK